MLLSLLLIICLCLLGLVFYYARRADKPVIQHLQEEVRRSSIPEERKLTLLIEAARAESARTPWFERSLSSVGVIVFLSTLGVAAVQAWQADAARRDAEVVRLEQQKLRAEAETQKQLLETGAEQLLENYDRNLSLSEAERALLSKTVEYRLQKKSRTVSDTRFLFRAYTILNDWTSAAALLVGQPGSNLTALNPQDAITASLRLYIIGEPEAAIQAVSSIALDRPEITDRARMDAWALRWAVQPEQHEALAAEAARATRTDASIAETALERRAMDLRQAATSYRQTTANRSSRKGHRSGE